MLTDAPRSLNVVLLLRVSFELSAVVVVTAVFVRLFGPTARAFGLTVAVMIVVSYIAVGVSPRTLGQQHADRVALGAAVVLHPLARVLGPITRLLISIGNAVTPGKGFRGGPSRPRRSCGISSICSSSAG